MSAQIRLLVIGLAIGCMAFARAAASSQPSRLSFTSKMRIVLPTTDGLDGSAIDIDAYHGTVIPAGRVGRNADTTRAASVPRGIDPVRGARSWKDRAAALRNSDSDWRAALYDSWITIKATTKLLTGCGLSPFEVRVDTQNGVVAVFGTVDTEDTKASATTTVMAVNGVHGVINGLRTVSDVSAATVRERDDVIRDAVRARLRAHRASIPHEIDVEVTNGAVRLTGTVSSQQARRRLFSIAHEVDGVRYVIDDLTVGIGS